jgi:hypothetical protein
MNLMLDTLWKNWSETVDGSGSTSVSGDILTVSAIIGEKGYRTCTIAPTPGETYLFSCEARVLTNNGTDPNPGLFIDYPTLPSTANNVTFDSSGQWRRYELAFTVPLNGVTTDEIYFGAGSTSSRDGSAEIRLPRLRSLTTGPVSQNLWAMAVVNITSGGVLTIDEQFNIENISWISGAGSADSRVFVEVPGIEPTLNHQPRPRAFISTTAPDGYIAQAPHFITGGTNGQFNVLVFDSVAGAMLQVDPSGSTYITIEVVY